MGFTIRGDTSHRWPRLPTEPNLHSSPSHCVSQAGTSVPALIGLPRRSAETCYRETYIGGTQEPEPRPADGGHSGDGGQRPPRRLSLLSAGSHGSSHASGEMSVDEPPGAAALPGEGASLRSSLGPGSRDPAGDTQDPGRPGGGE